MIEYRATLLEDLEEDEPTALDLGGTRVVLVRRAGAVRARPAAQGVQRIEETLRRNGPDAAPRIDVQTDTASASGGRDRGYPVRIVKGWVMVTLPGGSPQGDRVIAGQRGDARRFLIVGAGLAGSHAAETLRQEGFRGKVTILSADFDGPLQNRVLSGSYSAAQGQAQRRVVRGSGISALADVVLRHGDAAGLDVARREVILRHSHERIPYDRLLVATGCHVRTPAVPGTDLPGVHVFRTPADLDGPGIHIDALAETGGCRVVIVGGGSVGLEIARSLSARERVDVTAVPGAGRTALTQDPSAGQPGLRLVPDGEVSALSGNGRVERVMLASGEILSADIVLMAPHATPRTAWLPFPIEEDGGIVVQPDLSVPGHADVFLAGDIAHVPTRVGTLRIEHARFAAETGALAACNMLGRGMIYDALPPVRPEAPEPGARTGARRSVAFGAEGVAAPVASVRFGDMAPQARRHRAGTAPFGQGGRRLADYRPK